MIDTTLVFALFVPPVALLALIRPMGRLAFFLLGLLLFLLIEFVPLGIGPHHPLAVLVLVGAYVAICAAIAEVLVRIIRFVRRLTRNQ